MGKKKNKISFESFDLIDYLWLNARSIIYVGIAAFVVSLIVAFLITPKFKSTVILFPASSSSFSKALLSMEGQEDFLKFGGEEEAEQLMQVLYSTELRDRILNKFDLLHHYNINPKSKYWNTELNAEYSSNIQFHRTEYMSVVIEVWDRDNKLAADIANSISDQVDSVMTKIQHERAAKAFMIVENVYGEMQNEIKVIEDSIQKISENEIIGAEVVIKAYHTAYAKALAEGNKLGAEILSKKIKLLAHYGGIYNEYNSKFWSGTNQLSFLHERYMQVRVDEENSIPHKFVVDKAYPSDKKDKPKRAIIILASTFSAMFLMFILLLIKDSITNRKQD